MTTLTKIGENNITVTLDGDKKYSFITLKKDGKTIAEGYDLLTRGLKFPAGAVSALRGTGREVQALGQITTDLINSAIEEYNNIPEISLPRDRQELVTNIVAAYDEHDYYREQDYNEDIGLHHSAATELKIKEAEQSLAEFDTTYPEIAADINRLKAIKTERQIQSALNA